MAKEDPFNRNWQRNQGDIKKSPEDRLKQPPNTLLREQVKVIDGKPIPVIGEAYIKRKDQDGNERLVKQALTNHVTAADGRWLKVDDFGAISWTGLPIPIDRFIGPCLNPFDLHNEDRLVYLGVDGTLTPYGNILCADCVEHQDKRLMLKKLLLFGLLYSPEVF